MENHKSKIHFVLVAGFSSDNQETFGLRDILETQGYSTNAISFYGDLKFRDFDEIGSLQWIQSVSGIINRAAGEYEQVFGIGISLGGALLLEHAKSNNNLSGIVSIGTPFRLKNIKLIHSAEKCFPLIYPVWKMLQRIKKLRLSPIGAAKPMTDYFEGNFLENLGKIETPALFLHSRRDKVTDFRALQEYFPNLASPKKKIIFFENGNHVINYNPMIVENMMDFFDIGKEL